MTATEWLHCDDPQRLLGLVVKRPHFVAFPEFLAGCLAHMARTLGVNEEVLQQSLTTLAQKPGQREHPVSYPFFPELRSVPHSFVGSALGQAISRYTPEPFYLAVAAVGFHAMETGVQDLEAVARQGAAEATESRWQADLLRGLAGNPFQTSVVESGWLDWQDGLIPALARDIRQSQRFEDLPILADALEEASCADEHLLTRCCHNSHHVQKCWSGLLSGQVTDHEWT